MAAAATDRLLIEPEFNESSLNEEYFNPDVLSITHQWKLIYSQQLSNFLKTYKTEESDPLPNVSIDDTIFSHYERAALDIARYHVKHLLISFKHILEWVNGDRLASFLRKNFLPLWSEIDEVVDTFVKDTLRRYIESKKPVQQLDPSVEQNITTQQDPEFLYDIAMFDHISFHSNFVLPFPPITVRQLRTEHIGQLINLKGTATRMSDVRPELITASFQCTICHAIVENVKQQFKYTEPKICRNAECRNRVMWKLLPESCRFVDWQKVRLQENSSEIPAGSMPRVIEIILRRNLTDQFKPGDKLIITGCLAAVPDVPSLMKPGDIPRAVAIDRNRLAKTEQGMTDNAIRGLRQLGVRDLSFRLTYFAQGVKVITSSLDVRDRNAKDDDALTEEDYAAKHLNESVEFVMSHALQLPKETQQLFMKIAQAPNTLDQLAMSIAPEIFGCEYIKKGILLMLVGGIEKISQKDQLKLRGDINICIVGDPGTAKSQLLKFVHQFAVGRAVYTAGNTSTAAGLTVSIHKDADQGDSVIEAGALMLADQGICCIDEFEKMDTKDMVAIHEAMEQKTISICKAGIQATLNARASILAACNPRYGRYDLSKSFRQNIKLSRPIISRFDLFFTIIDDTSRDALIAQHIVNLHMTATTDINQKQRETPFSITQEKPILSSELLRKYLAISRSRAPYMSENTAKILVDSYILLRTEDVNTSRNAHVSVRQLESLIRLSEAVAKLKFSDYVLPCHVKEASKVMHSSFMKLDKGKIDLNDMDIYLDNDEENEEEKENINSKQPNQSLVIDGEEYESIVKCLIDHFHAIEVQLASQESLSTVQEAVIARDELITWYIENIADPSLIDSDTKTEQLYLKLNKIIDCLIYRDNILIQEHQEINTPVDKENQKEVRMQEGLRLHPNLTFDNYSLPKTNLQTNQKTDQTETSSTTEDQNDQPSEAWTLDDRKFLDYMYSRDEDQII